MYARREAPLGKEPSPETDRRPSPKPSTRRFTKDTKHTRRDHENQPTDGPVTDPATHETHRSTAIRTHAQSGSPGELFSGGEVADQ